MALDGAMLSLIKAEIEQKTLNARIDKIYQPSKEELVMVMRGRQGTYRLLLSSKAASPRIHFTEYAPENPKSPPMLCMLLRKHLTGAKLIEINQPGLERVLHLKFAATNDLGDPVCFIISIEIMGRHSNIILIDQNECVVDSVKRVNAEMSSVRLVLPGVRYVLPPSQGERVDLLLYPASDVLIMLEQHKEEELSKALLGVLFGFSPIVCREIAEFTAHGVQVYSHSLTKMQEERLIFKLNQVVGLLQSGGSPTMVIRNDTGKPMDFSFMPIMQYGTMASTKTFETYGQLLDGFYAERDRQERIKVKAQDLLKLLSNAADRIGRKIAAQRAELLKSGDREALKMMGDLINSNLHMLEKGVPFIEVENYFDEQCPIIRIQMDPSKTPSQNAQKYYKNYRRAYTAEQMLTVQIAEGERELEYIDTVFDALSRADTERELVEIRQELASVGYARLPKSGKMKNPAPLGALTFISSDGFKIFVGRNNRQNDRLTLKESHGNDIWLHTRNIPGSHVVIAAENNQVPDSTILEAAMLAANHSKAKDSSQVPVDYTFIKRVKKPAGSKPGKVTYSDFKTVFVTPDAEKTEKMRE